jgi:hypothetical protein
VLPARAAAAGSIGAAERQVHPAETLGQQHAAAPHARTPGEQLTVTISEVFCDDLQETRHQWEQWSAGK